MKREYMNAALQPEQRAEMLLKEMSLEEKMGQINTIFPFDKNYLNFEQISEDAKYGIGEVSTLEMRQMETLDEVAAWQKKVQEIVMANSEHQIPAIFHMEGLCGAFIQDSTSFPSGIGRGASFDTELEERIARIVSRQEAACGITHVLAPLLDITRDSRMGRQGECYGEDPSLVAAMGVAYTRGAQNNQTAGRRVESVAKHFLAFHNSQGGIHGTHSDTPSRLLQEIYGKPFQAAIQEADLKGVMPCYCSIDGEPVTASRQLLTGLLREEMGFNGLCVSDYGAIGGVHEVQHIGETEAEAGLLCMKAGMDIEMPSPTGYGEKLKQMFACGEAPIELLDEAVRRVLTAKFRMGLFEHPFALQGEELRNVFHEKEDAEISLQSARESLVLLKNEGALPISTGVKKIALIGPHADSPRKFFGGYTHMCMMESTYAIANSIAGVSGSENDGQKEIVTIPGTNIQSDEGPEFDAILNRQKPECKSLLTELRERLPESEILYAYGYPIAGADQSGFEEAMQVAKEADVVILTLGGKHGTCSMASMGEGVDASDINLPSCQDAFIKLAAELGKPIIGVHLNGRPISSDVADQYLHAIVEAWNPSEMGAQAITDVLLGDYNPGGKLPVSVAYHAGQIPIYYNHPWGSAWHQGHSIGFKNYVDLPHTPRYHFGHGLSYTEFTYTDLTLSTKEIGPEGAVESVVTVKNTGSYDGTEVVQLYITDLFSSMTRPVKELAGFARVFLKAGEEKQIRFTLKASQCAFLDREMKWKIEKGEIEVQVGRSSADICLKDTFKITKDAWIKGCERVCYTLGQWIS